MLGLIDLCIGERAQELITAVPKYQVVRAEPLFQGLGHVSKQLIPGGVSLLVVHGLQAVHINERDDKRISFAPCTIHLVLQLPKARSTSQGPGEIIDQVVLPPGALSIEGRLSPIEPGLVPVQGRLVPVEAGLLSMLLPLVM
jgi:hypothetical protein